MNLASAKRGMWWAAMLLAGASALAQPQPTPALPKDPRELVRLAVENDLRSARQFPPYAFLYRRQKPELTLTQWMIGTTDGLAGRSVAVNDQPLTPQQQQDEDVRLAELLADPSRLREKLAKQKENLDRSIQVLNATPKAFLYDYDGWEQRGTEKLVRLKFRPDPKYDPPTKLEMVLTTMTGTMLIEPKLLHLAKIDGTLQEDVAFGWGILGHLDKGGRILIEQDDVGDGNWQQVHMKANFTGKILLFKSLVYNVDQTATSYERVANGMNFAQGVEWLKKKAAQNRVASTATTR